MKRGRVVSPWVFSINTVGHLSAKIEQSLVAGLLADNTLLSTENKMLLQRSEDEDDGVCNRRKVNVNAWKSIVLVTKQAREQATDF